MGRGTNTSYGQNSGLLFGPRFGPGPLPPRAASRPSVDFLPVGGLLEAAAFYQPYLENLTPDKLIALDLVAGSQGLAAVLVADRLHSKAEQATMQSRFVYQKDGSALHKQIAEALSGVPDNDDMDIEPDESNRCDTPSSPRLLRDPRDPRGSLLVSRPTDPANDQQWQTSSTTGSLADIAGMIDEDWLDSVPPEFVARMAWVQTPGQETGEMIWFRPLRHRLQELTVYDYRTQILKGSHASLPERLNSYFAQDRRQQPRLIISTGDDRELETLVVCDDSYKSSTLTAHWGSPRTSFAQEQPWMAVPMSDDAGGMQLLVINS